MIANSDAQHSQICVIVLAHNEERRIKTCLDNLPIGRDGVAVHVVVNGSRDRTADIARSYRDVAVHDWEQGGKSRSWNRIMLDTPGIEAECFVFVDGDAEVLPGSIDALCEVLAQPGVNAAAGLPTNGRKVDEYRASMVRDHGLFGDLYALSGDFVRRLRASSLRLPEDLVGDDGLIGALAKTDLGHEREWRNERVMPVVAAGFLCEPVNLDLDSLRMQAKRMRNYSTRHFQNLIISDIMRGEGPAALPKRMVDLYPRYVPGFRPRWDPRFYWFDRQALAQMRHACAA
ncbi:MAG: glycosyltransferase family 2 protein [Alphaproteobacteria bacterium]|nr:MAG: glycosyltransferase family 2 protein [Alphaproteobacteria bacterium]